MDIGNDRQAAVSVVVVCKTTETEQENSSVDEIAQHATRRLKICTLVTQTTDW